MKQIDILIFDKNDELLMEANGDSKNLKYFKLSNSFFRLNRKIINTKKLKTKFEYLNDEEFETLTEYLYYYLQNCIDVHTHNDDFFEYDNPNVIEAHERNVIHSLKNIGIDPDSNWFANPQIKDVLPKRFWKKISGNDHEVYISQFLQLTKVNSISDDNEFNLLDDFSPTLSFYEGIISSLLKSMDFIGAVRGKHEVVFTRENTPQNTFDAIEKFANQTHPPTEILEYWMVTRLKIITLKNKQQFNDVFKIKRIAGFGYMLCFKIDNKEIDITSFGYGVMQLLPVLLKLAMHRGSLLVIEEPEANLHPAFQSKLADIFLDAIQKYGFTLIIETHSEYLIRKLQFLTASITSKLKPADTVIYYFYPPNEIPEGEPQIKKINIQDDGSLSDEFGTGFFDEADNIAMELFLLKQSQKN